MSEFNRDLLDKNADVFEGIQNHPLLKLISDGKISESQLSRYLEQVHLLVGAYASLLGTLASRAPGYVRRQIIEIMLNLHGEVLAFEEPVAKIGVVSPHAKMSFATHALVSYLHAAGHARSFPEALSVCVGINLVWREARNRILETRDSAPNPILVDLIKVLRARDFQSSVQDLGRCCDLVAETSSPQTREQMTEAFRTGIVFLVRFWDSIVEETDW